MTFPYLIHSKLRRGFDLVAVIGLVASVSAAEFEQAHFSAPPAGRAAVLGDLEENIIIKYKGHLDTGMLGIYFIFEYLRKIGLNDLVLTMFNQTTYTGFGYMVENGATTLWEQ